MDLSPAAKSWAPRGEVMRAINAAMSNQGNLKGLSSGFFGDLSYRMNPACGLKANEPAEVHVLCVHTLGLFRTIAVTRVL